MVVWRFLPKDEVFDARDPISPISFVLAMEYFSRPVAVNMLSTFKFQGKEVKLNNLCFAK